MCLVYSEVATEQLHKKMIDHGGYVDFIKQFHYHDDDRKIISPFRSAAFPQNGIFTSDRHILDMPINGRSIKEMHSCCIYHGIHVHLINYERCRWLRRHDFNRKVAIWFTLFVRATAHVDDLIGVDYNNAAVFHQILIEKKNLRKRLDRRVDDLDELINRYYPAEEPIDIPIAIEVEEPVLV